jgi:hypothetical protein
MATPVDSGCPYASVFMRLAPSSPPRLSAEEKEYVKQLVSIMPLEAILIDKQVKQKCRDLGQQIFDKVKVAHDSFAAKDVVRRICDGVCFNCNDGTIRKQYIEYAWHGIGYDTWRW